jgi:hypothetical protein
VPFGPARPAGLWKIAEVSRSSDWAVIAPAIPTARGPTSGT